MYLSICMYLSIICNTILKVFSCFNSLISENALICITKSLIVLHFGKDNFLHLQGISLKIYEVSEILSQLST